MIIFRKANEASVTRFRPFASNNHKTAAPKCYTACHIGTGLLDWNVRGNERHHISQQGCFFYFEQCTWQQIRECGRRQDYINDKATRLVRLYEIYFKNSK